MPFFLVLISVLLISCATQLTPKGRNIKIVTDLQKQKYCKSIDVISESDGFGMGPAEQQVNAMNGIRNRASKMDGNAINIISSNYVSDTHALIQAEVLKCNFPNE